MIYECTDCFKCASFSDGFRIVCLAKSLPADEVFKYQPLDDNPANNCKKFEFGGAREFDYNTDYDEAIKYSESIGINEGYKGIRKWCEKNLDKAI
jgi:hypothetical protein